MKQFLILIFTILFGFQLYGQSFNDIKKSAEQGYAKAQYNLGWMYLNGEGTLIDKKQAAYWIKKSYENGFDQAKEYWNEYELWKY